ncbi:hypothetical protein LY76DRAFT_608062 [Colletotrichum caudatum]|nr:hypothetical protein LY76DRAFT_608062 [Colletotrichum caudatum]
MAEYTKDVNPNLTPKSKKGKTYYVQTPGFSGALWRDSNHAYDEVEGTKTFQEATVHLLAPTGQASINIGGRTTYNYAGWRPEDAKKPLYGADSILEKMHVAISA